MTPVAELRDVTPESFARDVRPAGRPVVMRGLVAGWPIVAAARQGADACAAYLLRFARPDPVSVMHAPASARGLFHYTAAVDGFNFSRGKASLRRFLEALLDEAANDPPDAIAMQSQPIPTVLPGFTDLHVCPLTPGVVPRIWIGNAIKVATHNDMMENVACGVAGRRRFTVFPPGQMPNLYVGPLELTPAGAPISMVHVTEPDLAKYPRFAEALAEAQQAVLEPGDALYLPYHWWHHVESLDPFNILINYWWNDARRDIGSPWDALLHGLLSLRLMPPDQRAAWRVMFEHYVFQTDGDPAAHLPEAARGVLGPVDADMAGQLRLKLKAAVERL